MKLKPTADRVVLKPKSSDNKTSGGIVLPDTAQEKPQEGEIVFVGPGRIVKDGSVRSLEVKIGQRVLYGKYAGTEVKLNGEEYVILKEDELLAIIQS